MSKYILIACFLFISIINYAQTTFSSCSTAHKVCNKGIVEYDLGAECIPSSSELWLTFEISELPVFPMSITPSPLFNGYTLYGPFINYSDTICELMIASNILASSTSSSPYIFPASIFSSPGIYYIKLNPTSCEGNIHVDAPLPTPVATFFPFDCTDNLPCENCIGSFAPEAGKKYLISAWVREEGVALDKISFDNPTITVNFIGAGGSTGPLVASGLIIDGWQRIEKEFFIPIGTNELDIKLDCLGGNCLFDDIRVLPFDGSMKSYVYDPVTLRLAAELDERNYATFYEYDEEGKLLRVKKETEKGIMTIQESKTSVKKE